MNGVFSSNQRVFSRALLKEAEMSPKVLCAMFGSTKHPLILGDVKIPCFVLEDGTRIVTRNGVINALHMEYGTHNSGADRLVRFIDGDRLSRFVSAELASRVSKPIHFKRLNGAPALGYRAEILAEICESVLQARDAGVLQEQQLHIAAQCEILVRGLARVGIIALIDEATGYQEYRARRALEEVLDKFISEELRKWAKAFPDSFYREMFRLRGWSYAPFQVKRPSVVGRWTNDIVYERLAPGVLDELRRKNPPDEEGRRKHRHHQWLTEDVGHPRLREHLTAVTALMRASTSWGGFYRSVQRAFPRLNETMPLALDEWDSA